MWQPIGGSGSGLGVGQTWQNVKSSRALNTTYTNTTGQPIMVCVEGGPNSRSALLINGVALGTVGEDGNVGGWVFATICGVVPNGVGYKFTGKIGAYWAELR